MEEGTDSDSDIHEIKSKITIPSLHSDVDNLGEIDYVNDDRKSTVSIASKDSEIAIRKSIEHMSKQGANGAPSPMDNPTNDLNANTKERYETAQRDSVCSDDSEAVRQHNVVDKILDEPITSQKNDSGHAEDSDRNSEYSVKTKSTSNSSRRSEQIDAHNDQQQKRHSISEKEHTENDKFPVLTEDSNLSQPSHDAALEDTYSLNVKASGDDIKGLLSPKEQPHMVVTPLNSFSESERHSMCEDENEHAQESGRSTKLSTVPVEAISGAGNMRPENHITIRLDNNTVTDVETDSETEIVKPASGKKADKQRNNENGSLRDESINEAKMMSANLDTAADSPYIRDEDKTEPLTSRDKEPIFHTFDINDRPATSKDSETENSDTEVDKTTVLSKVSPDIFSNIDKVSVDIEYNQTMRDDAESEDEARKSTKGEKDMADMTLPDNEIDKFDENGESSVVKQNSDNDMDDSKGELETLDGNPPSNTEPRSENSKEESCDMGITKTPTFDFTSPEDNKERPRSSTDFIKKTTSHEDVNGENEHKTSINEQKDQISVYGDHGVDKLEPNATFNVQCDDQDSTDIRTDMKETFGAKTGINRGDESSNVAIYESDKNEILQTPREDVSDERDDSDQASIDKPDQKDDVNADYGAKDYLNDSGFEREKSNDMNSSRVSEPAIKQSSPERPQSMNQDSESKVNDTKVENDQTGAPSRNEPYEIRNDTDQITVSGEQALHRTPEQEDNQLESSRTSRAVKISVVSEGVKTNPKNGEQLALNETAIITDETSNAAFNFKTSSHCNHGGVNDQSKNDHVSESKEGKFERNPVFEGKHSALPQITYPLRSHKETRIDKSTPNTNNSNRLDSDAKTATSDIKRLIAEINAPAQKFTLSRDTPLSPVETERQNVKDVGKTDDKQDSCEDNLNEEKHSKPVIEEESCDPEIVGLQVGDLQNLAPKIARSSWSERHSQFDHLSHIERIDRYVEDMKSEKGDKTKDEEDVEVESIVDSNSSEKSSLREIRSQHTLFPDDDKPVETKLGSGSQSITDDQAPHKDTRDILAANKDDVGSSDNEAVESKPYRHTDTPRLDSPWPGRGETIEKIETAVSPNMSINDEDIIQNHRPTPVGSANESFGDDDSDGKNSPNIFRHTAIDSSDRSKQKSKVTKSRQRRRWRHEQDNIQTNTVETQTSDLAKYDTPISKELPKPMSTYETKRFDFARCFQTTHTKQVSLICSRCLREETNVHRSGFCETCLQFLCGECVIAHESKAQTRKHNILPCYCRNELVMNRHVPANGYCRDCREMFCSRCANNHSKLRRLRHHRILQSSFVSKPSTKQNQHETDTAIVETIELQHAQSIPKVNIQQRHSALTDQARYNPYRYAYQDTLPSIFSTQKKPVHASYTSNPRWPQTSFPLLPFLVGSQKPEESEIKPTRLRAYPDKPFSDAEVNVKMRKLKSLYGVRVSATTHQLKTNVGTKKDVNVSLPSLDTTSTRRARDTRPSTRLLKTAVHVDTFCLSIPFPSCQEPMVIWNMDVLMNGKLVVLDKKNNEVKLYGKSFICVAALKFRSRLVDICVSNLCETDLYVATGMYVFEISALRGLELKRKLKIEIRKIEGLACWKYGIVVVWKKTTLTWELRLLDYRGNVKSNLEILNPLSSDIHTAPLYHLASWKLGKYISIMDTHNACIITVDVITRKIVQEVALGENVHATYMASDGEDLFVSCLDKIVQVDRRGNVIGAVMEAEEESDGFRCLAYNKSKRRLYVQTSDDSLGVYRIQ